MHKTSGFLKLLFGLPNYKHVVFRYQTGPALMLDMWYVFRPLFLYLRRFRYIINVLSGVECLVENYIERSLSFLQVHMIHMYIFSDRRHKRAQHFS